jgi:hypothetical protein
LCGDGALQHSDAVLALVSLQAQKRKQLIPELVMPGLQPITLRKALLHILRDSLDCAMQVCLCFMQILTELLQGTGCHGHFGSPRQKRMTKSGWYGWVGMGWSSLVNVVQKGCTRGRQDAMQCHEVPCDAVPMPCRL